MSTAASSTTEPTRAEKEAQHGHAGTPGSYSDRQLGFWLVGAGLIALISSAILVYERLQIYIDAGHSTVCDINALLSCGTVMRTPQAEAFGFPNPFIGLVGFSIVVTIGAAIMAGAECHKGVSGGSAGCTVQEVVLGLHEHWSGCGNRVHHVAVVPDDVPDQRPVPVLHDRVDYDHHAFCEDHGPQYLGGCYSGVAVDA